ncbi:MAG: dethiobiotin synthase, partial [Vicinamibacteria bacterium]
MGKTHVGSALARTISSRGCSVGVLKPVETGCPEIGGRLVPSDALSLREAAGADEKLDLICPYPLRLPAAPAVAARRERIRISIDKISNAFSIIAAKHRFVIVEGAGGLLVPLDEKTSFVDLIQRLGLPVLVVARARLGTINHTLLTVDHLVREKIATLGVVINHREGDLAAAERENLNHLIARLGPLFLGEVPHAPPPPGEIGRDGALGQAFRAPAAAGAQDSWCRAILDRCGLILASRPRGAAETTETAEGFGMDCRKLLERDENRQCLIPKKRPPSSRWSASSISSR